MTGAGTSLSVVGSSGGGHQQSQIIGQIEKMKVQREKIAYFIEK